MANQKLIEVTISPEGKEYYFAEEGSDTPDLIYKDENKNGLVDRNIDADYSNTDEIRTSDRVQMRYSTSPIDFDKTEIEAQVKKFNLDYKAGLAQSIQRFGSSPVTADRINGKICIKIDDRSSSDRLCDIDNNGTVDQVSVDLDGVKVTIHDWVIKDGQIVADESKAPEELKQFQPVYTTRSEQKMHITPFTSDQLALLEDRYGIVLDEGKNTNEKISLKQSGENHRAHKNLREILKNDPDLKINPKDYDIDPVSGPDEKGFYYWDLQPFLYKID